MLSLYAASVSNAKLVTKINRIAFENIIQQMNLGSIIYPKMITADGIIRYVRAMQNSVSARMRLSSESRLRSFPLRITF